MGYDERCAQRVRDILDGEEGVTEKAMFGGLAFLVDGHLALSVSGRGVLMVRAAAEAEDRLLRQDGIEQTVMRGRPMRGWLDVDGSVAGDDGALAELVAASVDHARGLPPRT